MRAVTPLIFVAALTAAGISAASGKNAKGHLLIIGGGRQPAELTERFIQLAGGTNRAKVVVIPMASESPAESGEHQVAEFKSRGVANVASVVLTREEATNRAATTRLDGATGVFFTGGDQSRLAAIIGDSPVHQKLKDLYADGAVLGGTSAGAAVMSKVMITGEELLNDDKTNGFKFIKRRPA